MPHYKKVILASGSEILSISNPLQNSERRYIAGLDPIEEYDRRQMEQLGIPPQYLSPLMAQQVIPVDARIDTGAIGLSAA
jgi:hypothetical protein